MLLGGCGNDLRHYLSLVGGLWVTGQALEGDCGKLVFSSSLSGPRPAVNGFALPDAVPATKLCLVADPNGPN